MERETESSASIQVAESDQITIDDLQRLAGKRIFFGHQSVGVNILDGLKRIIEDCPGSELAVIETEDPAVLESPVFAHAMIGRNHDPASKMEHFMKIIDNGFGGKTDIAFFKFCYVDFDDSTDPNEVFVAYRTVFSTLEERYPHTRFVHMTMPLLRQRRGLKVFIKKLIGRGSQRDSQNAKRNEYNRLLIGTYEGQDPVFDLAGIESTHGDGSRETYQWGGGTYFALVPDYTEDGGHLNETGQRLVAKHLVRFLCAVAD